VGVIRNICTENEKTIRQNYKSNKIRFVLAQRQLIIYNYLYRKSSTKFYCVTQRQIINNKNNNLLISVGSTSVLPEINLKFRPLKYIEVVYYYLYLLELPSHEPYNWMHFTECDTSAATTMIIINYSVQLTMHQ